MKIKIYGKKNCPQCRLLCNTMQNAGLEFEYHMAEYHMAWHEGWRDNDSVNAAAAIAYCDNVLPAVIWHNTYLTFEDALDMAGDEIHNNNIDDKILCTGDACKI